MSEEKFLSVDPTLTIRIAPAVVWNWDFLGDGNSLIIALTRDVPWWKRKTCSIVFGSKWTKVEE